MGRRNLHVRLHGHRHVRLSRSCGRSAGADESAGRAGRLRARPRSTVGPAFISAATPAPDFPESSWSDPFAGGSNTFNSGTGFLGGGQIGANYQFNTLVLGIEGDFDWTGLKASGSDSIGDTLNTNTRWTSTVTGRVGAAFDRLLVYAKGGLALAQDQSSFTDLAGSSAGTSFMRTGWTVGAGLEYGITKNWSAKIEYDYLELRLAKFEFLDTLDNRPIRRCQVSTSRKSRLASTTASAARDAGYVSQS